MLIVWKNGESVLKIRDIPSMIKILQNSGLPIISDGILAEERKETEQIQNVIHGNCPIF